MTQRRLDVPRGPDPWGRRFVGIEVRGCDLWTFGADDTVIRKDSFWKIGEP